MGHGQSHYGKGCLPRRSVISKEEKELRYALAYGEITIEEFNRRFKNDKKRNARFGIN